MPPTPTGLPPQLSESQLGEGLRLAAPLRPPAPQERHKDALGVDSHHAACDAATGRAGPSPDPSTPPRGHQGIYFAAKRKMSLVPLPTIPAGQIPDTRLPPEILTRENMPAKKTPKNKPVIADSIARAAALMGITPALIRHAKAVGASGFRGHRLDTGALGKWLKSHPELVATSRAKEERTEALERKKLALQISRLDVSSQLARHLLEEERARYVPAALVANEWARLMGIIREEAKAALAPNLFRVFENRIRAKVKSCNLDQTSQH